MSTMQSSPSLDNVKLKFKTWRMTRTRGTRIPEELWLAAINVFHSEDLTLYKIARALRLNQTDLKKHIQQAIPIVEKASPPTFIEVCCEAQPVSISECIVEMKNSNGSIMKMCFKGKIDFDLLELGKSFWDKQA